jgi:hypothetical protein
LKHDRRPRPLVPIAAALALVLATSLGPVFGTRAGAQAQPPAPPGPAGASTPAPTFNPGAPTPAPSDLPTPTPSPTPAPRGRHHRGGAAPAATDTPEPSATPTSPAFATLDGTWEMQLQYIDHTDYSYLVIAQQPTGTISGTWRVGKQTFPFDGTYDGRLFHVVVKEPSRSVTLSGYVEGASDMVGLLDLGNGTTSTAFTAEHRAAQKGNIFKKTTTY